VGKKEENKEHLTWCNENQKKVLVVLNIFILLFFFFSAEVSLRLLNIGYGNAPIESDPLFHHRHPRRYVYLSHVPSGEYGGFLVYYNDEGLISNPVRVKRNFLQGAKRIALLGDSFMEGHQVPFSRSIAGVLESTLGETAIIKNYSVSSYCPGIYYLQWKNVVSKFRPAYIFMLLYKNDCSDDRGYATYARFSSEGELLSIPGPSDDVLRRLSRKSYVLRLLRVGQIKMRYFVTHLLAPKKIVGKIIEEDDTQCTLSEKYILRIAQEAKQAGTRFILMGVPSLYNLFNHIRDPNEFSNKWKEWADTHAITFIDLAEPFRKSFEETGRSPFLAEDMHFNETGHLIAAKEILRYLENQGK
jgi:lysophospholipase L1-like esterase